MSILSCDKSYRLIKPGDIVADTRYMTIHADVTRVCGMAYNCPIKSACGWAPVHLQAPASNRI